MNTPLNRFITLHIGDEVAVVITWQIKIILWSRFLTCLCNERLSPTVTRGQCVEAYCITTGTIWFRPSTILGFIRRNLRHCTSNLKQTAYIKLVRSVMDYSCVVWDPYLRKNIDKLEHIQRRAARFVKNDYRRDSNVTAMLQDLKWQPLADRRRDQRLILLYKIINGLVAILADQHIQQNPRPSRNRHTKTLLIHTCNTDIYKHSFIPRSTINWNSLPEAIVTSKTVDKFKAALLKRE